MRRLSWTTAITLASLLFLLVSVAAFGDTYNFYFSKPGKKQRSRSAPAPVVEQDEESAEDGDEHTDGNAAPAEAKPSTQTITPPVPAGGAPIVINNTNNIRIPTTHAAPAPVAPVPYAPAPAPAGEAAASSVATATMRPPEDRKPWRVGATAGLFLADVDARSSYPSQTYPFTVRESNPGAILSLGYDFSRAFGVNFYGGARISSYSGPIKFHIGGDLEFRPFRLNLWDVDVIELGLLAGASNTVAIAENLVSLHAGARINFNLSKDFGITTSGRLNFGYMLFEAGIMARI